MGEVPSIVSNRSVSVLRDSPEPFARRCTDQLRFGSSWIKARHRPSDGSESAASQPVRPVPAEMMRWRSTSMKVISGSRSSIDREPALGASTSVTIWSMAARSHSEPATPRVRTCSSEGRALRSGRKFTASHCRKPQSSRTRLLSAHTAGPEFRATASAASRLPG